MFTDRQRNPRRIGFLCSGDGAIFRKVVDACEEGTLESSIEICIADRECKSLNIASDSEIKTELVPRKNHTSCERFSDEILSVLTRNNIDLICLTFDSLLKGSIIEKYYGNMVNVHLSLLPSFPGFSAARRAIQQGVRYGGVTLHLVDESTDGGPILAQGVIPLSPRDDEKAYNSRIFETSHKLLVQVIKWYESNRIVVPREGQPYVAGARYDGVPFCPALEI